MTDKVNYITYSVKSLRVIFAEDLQSITKAWKAGRHNDVIRLNVHQISVAQDFIDYAEGNNNWCDEDLEFFEQKFVKTNPEYSEMVKYFNDNGYDFLTEEELGTLWIIGRCMVCQSTNIGPPDTFGKTAMNSSNEFMKAIELLAIKKDKNRSALKRGPKPIHYQRAYAEWLLRLHPWLEKNKKFKNRKEILVLIGLLLNISGFQELWWQFRAQLRSTPRLEEDGSTKWIDKSFTDYLHERMKQVYSRARAAETC